MVITAVVAGTGAYLGSYLKKKGENWATREDIRELARQTGILTQAAKEIEAKISNEMWEKQKRWEVKKDATFEAMKELATVSHSMTDLLGMFYKMSRQDLLESKDKQLRIDTSNEFHDALNTFGRASILASLVCSKAVSDKFEELELKGTLIQNHAITGEFATAFQELEYFVEGTHELARMVRAELRVGGES